MGDMIEQKGKSSPVVTKRKGIGMASLKVVFFEGIRILVFVIIFQIFNIYGWKYGSKVKIY